MHSMPLGTFEFVAERIRQACGEASSKVMTSGRNQLKGS